MVILCSTNRKDIGTLYLIFAASSGVPGTVFSTLTCMISAQPGSSLSYDRTPGGGPVCHACPAQSGSLRICQEAGRTLACQVLAHIFDLGMAFHASRSVGALARIVSRGEREAWR